MKIRHWSRVIALLAIVLASAALLFGCSAASGAQAKQLYHCPMHPDYVSDRPGDCPICGMRLVPMERASTPPTRPAALPAGGVTPADQSGASATRSDKTVYTCPMHPEVQADQPGKCPKCGMDLVKKRGPTVRQSEGPVAPGARSPAVVQASQPEPVRETSQPAGPPRALPDMPGMPGTSAPAEAGARGASPAGPNLAGVRTVSAVRGSLAGTIRTVGSVVTPETGVRQVTTKVAGWVQKLHVNSIGRRVRAGELLFELYSPELLATQEEYLHARQVAGQFATSSLPEVQRGGQDLVNAARRRLELFDVPAELLARLDETGKAQRTVTFRAPFGGYVLEKSVVEGQRVEPGMNLMTIADLSRAWVTAQLYEAEAGAAQVGHAARVSLPYDDTLTLSGRIDLVYPTLDTDSRTLKVRMQFPNPRLALKPGMYVHVELDAQRAQGVVVPDSALIDTGTRQVVFVQTHPGHFEPRDVQAGLRSNGKVILRSGVQAGEQVAVAGNFLLDSESRLRGMK